MHARTVYITYGETITTVGASQVKIIGPTKCGTAVEVVVTSARFEIDAPDSVREAVEAE